MNAMPELTTFDKVRDILVEQLGVDAENVTTETSFNELGADSLDGVELVMAFEYDFEIQFESHEEEKYSDPAVTVADVVRVIDEKIAEKK
jgi:acyl carrier protein